MASRFWCVVRTGPPGWRLLVVTWLRAISTAGDQAPTDDALAAWTAKRGLELGLNAEKRVFVACGIDTVGLAWLVSTLAEFSRLLEGEVAVTRVVTEGRLGHDHQGTSSSAGA